MKKAWMVSISIALLPLLAIAGSRSEARKQIESSMLLSGAVVIDAHGNVSSSGIDQAKKLPPVLVDFVQKHVVSWKFEPVLREGTAVPARSNMSLRLVVKKLEKGEFGLAIRSVNFTGDPPKEGEIISSKSLPPPRYPKRMARGGVSGTVYLALKIGLGGRVDDALVEQVNLRTLGTEKDMAAWRGAFSDAALEAARQWIFIPPVKGEMADDEFWSVRVPADFRMDGKTPGEYGTLEAYIPGPRQRIPWSDEDESGSSPDALADGGVYMLGQRHELKLLTKLGDGS